MKLVLLDGFQNCDNESYNHYIKELTTYLNYKNISIKSYSLKDLNIHYCIGCWNCWLKTPGVCIFKDDAINIYRDIIASDWLIFASPVNMGFVSSLIKKINDRLIPLILPYIDFVKGECHHYLRYKKSPLMGLVLQPEEDTDEEDLLIIKDIYKRMALNLRTDLRFFQTTNGSLKEAFHEISSI